MRPSPEFLHQLHQLHLIAGQNPCRDEDVHELRRTRAIAARMAAFPDEVVVVQR
jgi:hypothetical protein